MFLGKLKFHSRVVFSSLSSKELDCLKSNFLHFCGSSKTSISNSKLGFSIQRDASWREQGEGLGLGLVFAEGFIPVEKGGGTLEEVTIFEGEDLNHVYI